MNAATTPIGFAGESTPPARRGQPKGLYALFMTEMWERLGFYIIVGILVLYLKDTERGGLGMSLKVAAEIYGTYMAFVYFTPFLGGLIADRYLGYRLAVLIGGLLLSGGYFLLGVRTETALYGGLVLVCLGNGLFKPNITAMVGNLYRPGDPKRDSGFNIFYMGINIGAALSALLSAPLRNEWNYNVAFLGAGIGLLIGVGNLLLNWRKLAVADRRPEIDPRDVGLGKITLTILLPAAISGALGFWIGREIPAIKNSLGPITFAFLMAMVPIGCYFLALVVRATTDERPGLMAILPVYLAGGAFFMILHLNGGLITIFSEERTSRPGAWVPDVVERFYCQKAMPSYFGNANPALPRPSEETLLVLDKQSEAMFGARRLAESAIKQITQSRSDVSVVTFGDPSTGITNNQWDDWKSLKANVYPADQITVTTEKDEHGVETVSVKVPETTKPLREILLLRNAGGQVFPVILVSQETFNKVYNNASKERIPKNNFLTLLNAELIANFLNPLFVVLLTPVVVAFIGWRVRLGKAISTARKLLYGLLITTLALLVMAVAAYAGKDGDSKVTAWWIVLFYAVITVGELLLSPMGLSLVTKLSPRRFVGLMLGGWFVSTAVGNKLSGFISGLEPTARMFVVLSLALFAVAMVILALQPMLNRAIRKYGA